MDRSMFKIKLAFGVLALLSLATSFAQAQSGSRQQQQQQQACSRDVSRHCRSVMSQGDMAVLQCLKANRSKLGAACGALVDSH
jgi:Cysteine rich repeat